MAFAIGRRVGVYEIISLLGAGGMGEVYRARDTRLGRDVAIKVLPASLALDPDRLARFQREAQLLASLNHPNIAQIHGLEGQDGAPFIVMELVEGETLDARLKGSRSTASQEREGFSRALPLAETVAIARQIADALDAAHERGIVHRDLKPANIAITPDGVVKVLDFGLAKLDERSASLSGERDLTHSPTVLAPTLDGVLLGTAPYMSPEQARGKSVDKRADIWAFGCVLYEMLSGRRAFAGETTTDVLAKIVEREPDWTALPAATPAVARQLLRRCLEKDPKRRLRDIGDARIDLDAREPDPVAGQATSSRDRRQLLIGFSLGALGTAAAVVVALFVAGSARQTAAPPEIRFDLSLPSGVESNFTQLAISPDGQRLAVAPTFEGRSPLWLRPLNSTAGRLLPGTEGATFPFWSPDGKTIAFFANRKLKRIDVEGEAVEIVTDVQIPRGGAWQDDGQILFAPNATGPLLRVPAAGGPAVVATHLEQGQNDHRAPFILPDARHFLYYARGTPQVRGVYVARLDGSESKRLVDADAAAVYVSGHLLFVRQGDLLAQPFDLQRLALAGAPFRVAAGVSVNPGVSLASLSASLSGALAYVTGGARRTQFTWMNRSGTPIGTIGPQNTPVANPALSPDGQQIAFSQVAEGNWDIWLMNARESVSRFTSDPALDFNPIWSADGRSIFFQSTRGGAPDLYSRSVNAGTLEQVLLKSQQPKAPSDVSPDGRVLLYNVSTGTSTQIWSLPLDGRSSPQPFAQTTFDERDGQFSPDGKWVAYQSNQSGRYEVYLQPFPGPGERIPVSSGGGQQVRWGRRGPELFYVAGDRRLTAVPVTFAANGTIRLGAPAALFPTVFDVPLGLRQQYVVSADGQRILMNKLTDAVDALSMTMILNWKGKP